MDHDTWTVRVVLRRFLLGSGPLKRGSDRLQVLARVLLVCILTVSVPVALAVATSAHEQARTQAVAESAARHLERARLLEDAPETFSASGDVVTASEVRAVWPGPSGERRGLVGAPSGAKADSLVPIWVDEDGHLTHKPLDDGEVVSRSVGFAVLTLILIQALAFGSYGCLRVALDRGRSRRWAAEWAAGEPLWNPQIS